jgi:cytochrome c oxidase subunit IV
MSTMTSSSLNHAPESVQGLRYATFIKVWVALVVLTAVLVGLSSTHSPNLTLLGLLVVTPTKVSLVFLYFMHLKHESTALKYMVAVALAVLVIFIGLTFTDFLLR